MEARVARLEDDFRGIRSDLSAIRADLSYLRGKVEQLPTTWVMLTGIIGGQVALAGLLIAAAKLFAGH